MLAASLMACLQFFLDTVLCPMQAVCQGVYLETISNSSYARGSLEVMTSSGCKVYRSTGLSASCDAGRLMEGSNDNIRKEHRNVVEKSQA